MRKKLLCLLSAWLRLLCSGDILPTTTRERLSSVAVITLGAFLYAYIIGSFSTIMATLDYDRARYDTKMRTVSNYLRFIGSDDETTMRVNKFCERLLLPTTHQVMLCSGICFDTFCMSLRQTTFGLRIS